MHELAVRIEYLPNYDRTWGPVKYEHEGDSGFDLRSTKLEDIVLRPNDQLIIKTGIKVALLQYSEMQIRSRSGLSSKFGIVVLNQPGTVDSCYRGEVGVILKNLGHQDYVIKHGDRIAQGVICPVYKARFYESALDSTSRGEGGYGSTGVSSN